MNNKEEAIHAITSLPEDASMEEIMYRLYVIEKIHKGQNAIRNNQVITTDELKKEVQNW
jgi:hypothetical protein